MKDKISSSDSSESSDKQFASERSVKVVRVNLDDIEREITEPSGEIADLDFYHCDQQLNEMFKIQDNVTSAGYDYSSKDFKTCVDVHRVNTSNNHTSV